jgi:hypothetical protein
MSIAKFSVGESAAAPERRFREVVVCSDSRMMPDPLRKFEPWVVVRRVAGAVLTPQKAEAVRAEIEAFRRRFPQNKAEVVIIGHGPFSAGRMQRSPSGFSDTIDKALLCRGLGKLCFPQVSEKRSFSADGEVEEQGPGMCDMTHGDEAAAKIKTGLSELSIDADGYARSCGAADFVTWFGRIERPDNQVRKDLEAARQLTGADYYSGYVCDLRNGLLGHVAGDRSGDVERAFTNFAEERFIMSGWRERSVADQKPAVLSLATPEFGHRAHAVSGARYPGEVFVVTLNEDGPTPAAVKSCLYALLALKVPKLEFVTSAQKMDGAVARIKANGLLGPLVQGLIARKELATGMRTL